MAVTKFLSFLAVDSLIGDVGAHTLENLWESANLKKLHSTVSEIKNLIGNVISNGISKFDPNQFTSRLDAHETFEGIVVNTSNYLSTGFSSAAIAAVISTPLLLKGVAENNKNSMHLTHGDQQIEHSSNKKLLTFEMP